jgi:hypothetical protein
MRTPTQTPTEALTHRDRAILRAVGLGTAEIVLGAEPDLFLDGRCCCDQVAAHRLARAGLIAAAEPGAAGERVSARLTRAGRRLSDPVGEGAVVRLDPARRPDVLAAIA